MRHILLKISALGFLAALILSACSRRMIPTTPTFQNTDEMMRWFASEAVDLSSKNHGVDLDYSTNSIERAEAVLARLHDEYRHTSPTEGVQGLAMMFGAYIGESIRRSDPNAKWEMDHPVFGKKCYPLHWGGSDSFPCAWCYRRITEGPEDNVWHKYQVLAERQAGRSAPASVGQPLSPAKHQTPRAAGSSR